MANSSEPSSGEHSTLPCGTPDMQLDDEDCSEPTATYSSFQKYKRLQPVESDTTDDEILRDAIEECAVIIVVPYELYELYDWGTVPELYGTL